MRVVLISGVLAAAVLFASVLTDASAMAFRPPLHPHHHHHHWQPSWKPDVPGGPCSERWWVRIPGNLPSAKRIARVKSLITCAVRHWSVPGGVSMALCIAGRESGFAPAAENPSSGAAGLFQTLPDMWPGRRAAYLQPSWFGWMWPPSAFNGRANALWAVQEMHRSGLGAWGGGCG